MATVAQLMVKIEGNNSKLESSLKKSRAGVKKFAKQAGDDLKKFAKVSSVAMVAAFAGVSVAVSKVASDIDVLAKTSAKLGVGVAELQKLQFQAELTGVSSQTLGTALQRMVRRVSEAAKGAGEAKDAIKELGLDAARLASMSPDKQFNAIAAAMGRIANKGDQVRLAMRLFDTEGVSLVNTFNSSLEDTGKEFDKLGISLTNQQAKAVEGFNDSATKLRTIWSGFSQQVVAQLAPAFSSVLSSVQETIMGMGGMKKVANDVAISVLGGIRGMVKGFAFLSKTIEGVKTVWSGLKAVAAGAGETAARATVAVQRGLKNSTSFREEFAKTSLGPATTNAVDALVAQAGKVNTAGSGDVLTGIIKNIQENQKVLVEQGKTNSVGKTPGIVYNSGPQAQSVLSSSGTISSNLSGGRNNGQQSVKVHITTDDKGMIKAVVDSDDLANKINQSTENSARQVRR